MKSNRNGQSGNAVIIILIAVALFAALSYTFMRGGQQGQGNMTAQQAKIAAQEILSYAQTIERTISRLRNRGCSEGQISFDYDIAGTTGYENPNAPVDLSCHVFDTNGGKLSYTAPQNSWLDQGQKLSTDFGKLIVTGKSCVYGVGTNTGQCAANGTAADQELLLIVPYVRKEICDEMNKMMNSAEADGSPSTDAGNSWALNTFYFVGIFEDTSQIGSNTSPLKRKTSACYEGDVNPPAGTYHIYNVLVVR